jgi:hypothetical protein
MFGLAIAAAACRKGSLMEDAGALPTGKAGETGSDGPVGGAGGQSGAGGNDGGMTGVDGIGECTGGGSAVCPVGVAGPTEGVATGPCTTEGATCALFDCHGVATGNATCCQGQWWALAGNTCPGPLEPGDTFRCGNTSTTCIAGQSYCRSSNRGPAAGEAPSCQPLCPAGDCTCFCDNPTGCDFAPEDQDCEMDRCSCSTAFDPSGLPLRGGIAVVCTYAGTPSGACYPAEHADPACVGAAAVVYCTGTSTPVSGCTLLAEGAVAPACRTTESRAYCCEF